MKNVCYCYDNVIRKLNYVQRHYKKSDGTIVHYGRLNDIVICKLYQNAEGWCYKLTSNSLVNNFKRIPVSVHSGVGFTTRRVCFEFVIDLIQIQKSDYISRINLNE